MKFNYFPFSLALQIPRSLRRKFSFPRGMAKKNPSKLISLPQRRAILVHFNDTQFVMFSSLLAIFPLTQGIFFSFLSGIYSEFDENVFCSPLEFLVHIKRERLESSTLVEREEKEISKTAGLHKTLKTTEYLMLVCAVPNNSKDSHEHQPEAKDLRAML